MPISYTNAFGGKEYPTNPVSIGIDEIDINGELVVAVPNIEYTNSLIGSPTDKPAPASLNRINMMCEQRIAYAGTYDQNYIETRMPGYPDDFDYRSFNDAAKDQWSDDYFHGDETYEIRNMNSEHPVLKGCLPEIKGRAFVNHEVNGAIEFKEMSTHLDTVWLFPGAELGVMIHRGTVEVSQDDAADIKQILIANENMKDTPREHSHYQNELALRTDPEEALKYLLYTTPLIPEGCTCGFKIMQENSGIPLELISNENIEKFTDTKKPWMSSTNS
jgi:hypothetical protein